MNMLFPAVCYCIVGSNVGAPGTEALHILECDNVTGAAKIVQTVKGIEGTTYFQPDKRGEKLFSVISEMREGKKQGAAVVFNIKDNRIGEMTKLAALPCEVPCHVGLSPDEGLFAFAAYTSATWGTVPLALDGVDTKGTVPPVNGAFCARLADEGMGPRTDRQKKAYAHCAFFTPNGKKLGIIDLGCDAVFFYDLGGQSPLALRGQSPLVLKADPGDGPRHAIFSKDGRHLFVVNELSSSVTSYAYDGKEKFTRIGKWSMLPKGTDPLTTKAAAIKLTEDGKILMASNRGCDSIAFFEVKNDGELELKNIAPLKGRFPRDFELMPGERFMVVGHKMSDEIQVYRVDMKKGTLDPVGEAIPAWRPLCFKFR
jgi:6-phosphogluconolactonase